jgi:glycosyltransferase involved in cell wall biosynthesis
MHTPNPPFTLCVDARFLTPHFPGIGRVLSALLNEWAQHPHITALHIITNQRQPAPLYATPAARATVHYHPIDAHPFGVQESFAIRRIVAQVCPDWYYCPHFWVPWVPLPTRLMVTIHDAIPLHADHVSLRKRWLIASLMRWCIWRANSITTVSTDAAQQLTRAFAVPQLSVIPNGAPLPLPPLPAPADITTPYLLCVSSNQPHKNLVTLCTAWRQLWQQQRLPATVRLVIAGHIDPRYPHPAQWLAESEAPVTVVANPSEAQLHALYQHATWFVTPSLAEGHGFPVYEALSYGLAVLHHQEFPNQAQLTGATQHCDMRSAEHLALALRTLLHSPKQTAQHQLPHQLSWQQVAQRYLDVMTKIPPDSA